MSEGYENNRQLEINNRIAKRFRHLSKWAKGQQIEYFRVFDRDLPGAPIIIDSVGTYWLVWLCDNHWSSVEEKAFLKEIKNALTLIEEKPIILKDRKKDSTLEQRFNQSDKLLNINEGDLTFKLNLTRYLDTGLFIDHRKVRSLFDTSQRESEY